MRVNYRGHEINVERGRSMGGPVYLYYSIFRESDGFECDSGFVDSAETIREMIKYLKERVDAELLEDNPWDEV